MNRRRVLVVLLRMYPTPWRVRYGAEFESLIDDLLGDANTSIWRLALGLLLGALRERIHPEVRVDRSAAPGSDSYQLQMAVQAAALRRQLLGHRDFLLRKTPTPHLLSQLEPGEDVIGTFDAEVSPGLLHLRQYSKIYLLFFLFEMAIGHNSFAVRTCLPWTVVAVVAWTVATVVCRVKHVRRAMFLLTTHGLVEFDVDWLLRPTHLRSREPAIRPKLIRTRFGRRQIRLGDRSMWVNQSSIVPLRWAGAVIV